MTDADLRALFESWLRDRAQVHKLAQLQAAQLRAYTEAVTAAAVRTAYPPQVRAQSPAEAPPAAEEGRAVSQEPEDRRGHATGAPGDFRCRCIDWSDIDGCCKKPAPAITHADGSPLRRCQDDFGRRHASRLDRREAWERGPIIPRRTEDRA